MTYFIRLLLCLQIDLFDNPKVLVNYIRKDNKPTDEFNSIPTSTFTEGPNQLLRKVVDVEWEHKFTLI